MVAGGRPGAQVGYPTNPANGHRVGHDGRIRGVDVLGATGSREEHVRVPRSRHMLVVAVEGCHSLDVLGPVEVFAQAAHEVPGAYRVDVVAPVGGGMVTTENGVRLGAEPLPEPPPRHDTLIVAGGAGARAAAADAAVVDWIVPAPAPAPR